MLSSSWHVAVDKIIIMTKSKKEKTLKTTVETKTWKNKKSIDLNTLTEKENKVLIQKVKKWKLPWYHIVKEWTKDEHLRSNPDRKKSNNLDPKIKKPIKKKKKSL